MMEGFALFAGVRRADAVIVGGGLTGLMTGDALSRMGMRVIVLDAQEPGCGASGLCAGAATLLAAPLFQQIIDVRGMDAAQQHAEALRAALWELPEYLTPLAPFRTTDAYVYALLPRDLPALGEQEKLFDTLHLPVHFAPDAGGCPFPVELSLMMGGQLLVDVGALMEGLIRRIRYAGGQVISSARVIGLAEGRVHTQEGRVDAPVVILAAGKPPGDRRPKMLSLLQSRTMAACTMSSTIPLHTCQQSVRAGGLALTPVPGGAAASWCTGHSGTSEVEERAALLSRVLSGRMPDWTPGPVQYRQEIWPTDGLPVIGELPEYRSRVLCATGYAGHGILGAMLAARVLSRCVNGRSHASDALYSPGRGLPWQPALRGRSSQWTRRAAAPLRPRLPACTLCHCRLRYLIPGRRWECPVCGSAFGMFGSLLNGPAVRDANISARQRPDL